MLNYIPRSYVSRNRVEQAVFVRQPEGDDMVVKEWEFGARRTLVAAMAVLLLTAIMLALPESALALPSEVPDNTPMVDGRVRAIEQVGTNLWLGGKFTQVEKRDGTVLSVSNLAVFNSERNEFKNIAPALGGTNSEVWELHVEGLRLHTGGEFKTVSGVTQNSYARLSP